MSALSRKAFVGPEEAVLFGFMSIKYHENMRTVKIRLVRAHKCVLSCGRERPLQTVTTPCLTAAPINYDPAVRIDGCNAFVVGRYLGCVVLIPEVGRNKYLETALRGLCVRLLDQ